ncbi:unnamed protein product [Musa acuminata subsp. burmannicoides]
MASSSSLSASPTAAQQVPAAATVSFPLPPKSSLISAKMEKYDFVRSTQILKCCMYLIYGAERFWIRLDILFLILEPMLGIVLFLAVEKCFLSSPSHGGEIRFLQRSSCYYQRPNRRRHSLGLILSLMPRVVGGSANDAASFEAKAKQPASQERGYGGRNDVAAMISAIRGGRQ